MLKSKQQQHKAKAKTTTTTSPSSLHCRLITTRKKTKRQLRTKRSFATTSAAATTSTATITTQSQHQDSYSRVIYGPPLKIPKINLLERILTHANHPHKLFFRQDTEVYSYFDLVQDSLTSFQKISAALGPELTIADPTAPRDPHRQIDPDPTQSGPIGPRVGILAPASFAYSSALFGTWMNRAVAVPLHVEHPIQEMLYSLTESQSRVLVAHPDQQKKAEEVKAAFDQSDFAKQTGRQLQLVIMDKYQGTHNTENTPFVSLQSLSEDFTKIGPSDREWLSLKQAATGASIKVPVPAMEDPALFIFTSGTTGKPKAVVLSHLNLCTQISGMVHAWEWKPSDHIAQFLPLHHVHGIVNVQLTAIWCGARITAPVGKFNPTKIWDMISAGVDSDPANQVMLTKRDINTLRNRRKFAADVTLECGVNSSRIPSLKQCPINYNLQSGELPPPKDDALTIFMAVPTVYHKLIEQFDLFPAEQQALLSKACSQFRLMVSGSMALPISTLDRWKKLSLHTLLERYGMSELGMGVTNPYRGQRVPGSIGFPFPGVRVRVNIKKQDEYDNEESPQPDTTTAAADPSNQATTPPTQPLSPTTFAIFPSEEEQSSKSLHDHHIYDDEIGELLIQGDNVFTYYFNRPDATKESFIDIPQLGPNTSPDGSAYDPRWFKTGDIARIDGKDNRISLLGRNSADILKIAGFKVSALQIERAILEHPGVATTAVVGLPSESTGQSIAALIVPNKSWAQQQNNGKALDFDALSAFLSTLLGKYKLPREVIFVDDIPVNAMGKINKKHLSKMLMEMPEIAESKWRK